MPFTPVHFGPGALAKALAPRYFSFTVFVFAQVLIDVETLYYLLQDDWPVHRFFHTYVGATLAAAASFVLGRPVCGLGLAALDRSLSLTKSGLVSAMRSITPTAALSAAVFGAYSHVVLDSIMHDDARPLRPFTDTNILLHIVGVGELQLYCVIAGIAGGVGLGFQWLVRGESRR